MKKIFFGTSLLLNLNNLKCTEAKLHGIKYVLNNFKCIGGKNYIFKEGESEIKDIINVEEVKKKTNKILFNNQNVDFSTQDSHIEYLTDDIILYDIFVDNLKSKKLKLVKVEKKKYKENGEVANSITYEEGKEINDGNLSHLNEKLEKNTNYIFYYEYDMKFPAKSINVKYNNEIYTNNSEINIKGQEFPYDNFDNNTELFISKIFENITNSNKENLKDKTSGDTTPIHLINCKINKSIQFDEDIFLENILKYLIKIRNQEFKSLEFEIDKFFKYEFILEPIKGYYFKKEFIDYFKKYGGSFTKQKDILTDTNLKKFLSTKCGIDIKFFNITYSKKLEVDGKINEDNKITIKLNIDGILKDNDAKTKINGFLEEKKYKYRFKIYKKDYVIANDDIRNNKVAKDLDGNITSIEDLKAKIKSDLGLDEGKYEIVDISKHNFDKDEEIREFEIKITDPDVEKTFFKKIERNQVEGKQNNNGNGDKKGIEGKNGYCGSNK